MQEMKLGMKVFMTLILGTCSGAFICGFMRLGETGKYPLWAMGSLLFAAIFFKNELQAYRGSNPDKPGQKAV